MAKKSSGIVYPQAVPKAQRYTRKNYAAYVLKKVHKELGGIPAMVEWARDNPTEFYKLWGKLIPIEANMQIEDTIINVDPTTVTIESGELIPYDADAERAARYRELIGEDPPETTTKPPVITREKDIKSLSNNEIAAILQAYEQQNR